jgi:phosphonate transport system substrate-binding protein
MRSDTSSRHGRGTQHGRGFRGAARSFAAALLLLALIACSAAEEPSYTPQYSSIPPSGGPVYIFAPHPMFAPQKLATVYGAMVDRINALLAGDHIRIKLEASRNYAAFNDKIYRRQVHFALPNPYQTLLSRDCGYSVFGKMLDDSAYCGVILVRRDNPVANVQELRGAAVSFPAPTSLAGTMLPEMFFRENGLDPRHDIRRIFAGTHDSALMNVCIGASAAACVWLPTWEIFQMDRPDMAGRIEARWHTASLPSSALIVRDDVPADVREKIAAILFHMRETPVGRSLLEAAGTTAFVPADDTVYAPVRAFVQRYERSVGPLARLHD